VAGAKSKGAKRRLFDLKQSYNFLDFCCTFLFSGVVPSAAYIFRCGWLMRLSRNYEQGGGGCEKLVGVTGV